MEDEKYTAIIIDDEKWTREVVKSLGQWDALNISVIGEASDGEYGLEMIRRLDPDIILTDVRMPRLNGIDLVGLLRREHNTTPVLIISGYDDFAYMRSALQLGVTDYLLKPIKAEELNAQLRRCTGIIDAQADRAAPLESRLSAGFDHMDWAKEYIALQNQLRDALRTRDSRRISGSFDRLHDMVVSHTGEEPSKSVVIGIYYTLENLLRRFIVDSGYSIAQIYGGTDYTFVFSSGTHLTGVLEFLRGLFLTAVRQTEELQRNRNRLDTEQIRSYIASHCTEGITLKMVADRFYVSMEYLSKVFKSTYGEGFTEYVTRLRMEKAAALISDGALSLKEIGEAVGYYDQAHFYKTFKKIYGKAPGQYRQDSKIDNKQGPN